MSLNSGGGNDNGQNFFQKIFRRGGKMTKGGKWQRGENDKGGKMTEGITVIFFQQFLMHHSFDLQSNQLFLINEGLSLQEVESPNLLLLQYEDYANKLYL